MVGLKHEEVPGNIPTPLIVSPMDYNFQLASILNLSMPMQNNETAQQIHLRTKTT